MPEPEENTSGTILGILHAIASAVGAEDAVPFSVQGVDDEGAAITGRPVLIGGRDLDGTVHALWARVFGGVPRLLVEVVPPDMIGGAPSVNPLLVAFRDADGNIASPFMHGAGAASRLLVEVVAPDEVGDAPTVNPLLVSVLDEDGNVASPTMRGSGAASRLLVDADVRDIGLLTTHGLVTTEVALVGDNPDRLCVHIRNESTLVSLLIYDTPSASAAASYVLAPGQEITLRSKHTIYGIAATTVVGASMAEEVYL